MPSYLLTFAPLIAMLCIAAVLDLRRRRIPNALCLLILATGLMQSVTAVATVGPWSAGLGLLVGAALTAGLYMIGALGGGDVKLLAGCGAWLGAGLVFKVFLAAAVIGMILVVAQCLLHRRFLRLCRNSAKIAVSLVHLREVGVEHARATGESCRSVDRPLPYAVPVLFAVVALLSVGGILPW